MKVGLTGGIASGKSFVAGALAGYGCFVIQADEIGRQVLATGGEAYAEAVREFGAEILMAEGAGEPRSIDRRRLASLVFADAEKLARLNAIVHPAVIRREEELAAEFFAREPHGIAVVEAAILIETGSYHRFDKLILVFCAQEQQIERAMRRETTGRDAGRTSAVDADIRARIGRQMPLEEKRKYADFVIDTSGMKDDTLRQTRTIYEELRRIES
jgi:dephospho-CoA kinase